MKAENRKGCLQRDSVERQEYAGAWSISAQESTERGGASDLLEHILERDNLNRAYKQVKRNHGEPGIDGMTVEAAATWIKGHREELLQSIREGRYKPSPVRRKEIPKPDGGVRKLGIPTVLDRVIQQAISEATEKLFDQGAILTITVGIASILWYNRVIKMQKWVFVVLKKQLTLPISDYLGIYELIIPKDNLLRRIKEEVSFTFVYDELVSKYCLDNGRNAIDPLRMLKYLLLKCLFRLSDVDVVERSRYDMSFKYFLDMIPEEDVIDPSSLTKFRKLRLKDLNLMDLLIQKSAEMAIEKGVIKSNSLIVDSTHTFARYNAKSPREQLRELSKALRRAIYEVKPEMKDKLPPKVNNGILETELIYSQKLINETKSDEVLANFPKVRERLNALQEAVADDLEQLALLLPLT